MSKLPLLLPRFWRRIGIGCTGCDRRISLQALLELHHDLHYRSRDPCVLGRARWVFLFRIGKEIEDLRHAKLSGRAPPVALRFVERHFPVAPFHRLKTVSHEDRKAFAVRFLLTQEKVRLIYAVDGAILRNRRTRDVGERRERVYLMHNLVADPTRRDLARPTDDKGNTQRTFHVGEVIAAPRTGKSLPGRSRIGTVVAGEHDNRVVADAKLVNRVENLAHVGVHLGKSVREVAVAGLSGELLVRQRGEVDERERHVGVEGFAGIHAAFHEVDRPTCNLSIDQATLLEVVDDNLTALFALAAFHDMHEGDARRLRTWLRWKHRLVCGARNAVPFVKTLVVRQSPLFAAEVPFAEVGGGIADTEQHFGDRHLPLCQSLRCARQRYEMRARADRMTPGHQTRTAGSALRLDVEIRQPRALGCELVDARCRRTTNLAAAIAARFAITKVVHQDENDVGLCCHVLPLLVSLCIRTVMLYCFAIATLSRSSAVMRWL